MVGKFIDVQALNFETLDEFEVKLEEKLEAGEKINLFDITDDCTTIN